MICKEKQVLFFQNVFCHKRQLSSLRESGHQSVEFCASLLLPFLTHRPETSTPQRVSINTAWKWKTDYLHLNHHIFSLYVLVWGCFKHRQLESRKLVIYYLQQSTGEQITLYPSFINLITQIVYSISLFWLCEASTTNPLLTGGIGQRSFKQRKLEG